MTPAVSKEDRHARILRLVRDQPVSTQAGLTTRLVRSGIDVDQSTLSRDLAELGIRKVQGAYRVADRNGDRADQPANYAFAVRWFTPCGPNLVVIATEVGQAHPVALFIESHNEPSILATLAGDDTIYLATRSRKSQTVALRRLKQWFGEKKR